MEKHDNLKEELISIRAGTVMPDRAGEFWTPEERCSMLSLFQSGAGLSDIALELKRTEMAVVQQLFIMGLFSRPNAVHHRKKKLAQCLCAKCGLADGCAIKNQVQTQSAFDMVTNCCSAM